ncbi:TetR/AcrR family transcriptional regulator [Clostridium sp. SHJSY1]|uniref:TetR/AcrR family transcriptional regulator n=1 Tax=Clostridium sp. SHJSY1 TaxID=2942483 RepID=UPI00287680CC|nr:TetR/AcrR family transcriptional regulator [Clostridium sp. SHJSY1]MDS0524282.1 TetR/AcrR family transcriptional regulator [Clostridium sp. SHJSY1]
MSISEAKRKEIESKRREQILSVSLSLFYKNGYTNTKISDIAEAAGISKGLVYRYFESKAEILFSYLDFLNECLEEIKTIPSAKTAIKEFGLRFLSPPTETCYNHPLQVYAIVFVKGELNDTSYKNPISNNFGKVFFGPIFEKGIQSGDFKEGNPDEFGNIYWHYLLGHIMDLIQNPDCLSTMPNLDTVIALFEP